jgi:predicted TIM-barrel fold metal-dependent hydrolase
MANHRIIDCQQHFVPPKYKKMLADIGVAGSGENQFPRWEIPETLEKMDENGVEVAIGSIASPGFYFGDIEFSKKLARTANEESAEIVAGHPNRFGGLVNVPLPDVDAAIKELEYGLDELKLDGVLLLSHQGDRHLGQPEEDELYAEMDRRGVTAVIHPLRTENVDTLPKLGFKAGMTELTFGTTRAIINLLYWGVFAKYPNIKWVMPHAGGVMPFLTFRLNSFFENNEDVQKRLPGGLYKWLREQYYDTTLSALPGPLACLMEIADPEKIVFGSDYPFALRREYDMTKTIEGMENFKGWTDAQREKMWRQNALKIFPRFG